MLVNAFIPNARTTVALRSKPSSNREITPTSSIVSSSMRRWLSNENNNHPDTEESTVLGAIPLKVVAVAGATGRTGSLVVQELLSRNVSVVAMVRNLDKAQDILMGSTNTGKKERMLTIQKVDLTSKVQVSNALEGCDAVVWCATGFSDAPQSNWFQKIQRLLGIALAPQQSIDATGLPLVANALLDEQRPKRQSKLPQVVMLSSAGVTRTKWSDAKKKKFAGCADIPIVRLNPFGILDIKAESEQKLRESGKSSQPVRYY